jgi:LysR family transcriptional regulator, regulator for bpeEF and oprC
MDRLQAMQTFVKVVEMNSFSRAADSLGMPRASATTTIKNLEAYLKINLMHRTTRRLNLTPEGAQYYELCVRVLSDIEECEHALTKTGKGPRGQLRVDMPGSIGRLIVAPRIMEFRNQYPDIDLVIGFVDRSASLAHSTVDCTIRSGHLHDSSFISRPLGEVKMVMAASADYLERHGHPRSVAELEGHYAVHYYSNSTGRVVAHNLVIDDVPREVKMKRSLVLSDVEAYVTCGLAGAGIIQAPGFLLQNHLDEARLIELLPQWKPLPIQVSAQYAPDKHLAGKVRVFVEWVAGLFNACDGIDGAADGDSERPAAHSFSELLASL